MFRKILVATDFSKASRAALHAAISLAKRCDSKLEAVHIASILEAIYNSERLLIPADWRSEMAKHFEDFFPKSLYPGSVKEVVIGGSAAPEILKHARKTNSDLIVIGSHGRGAIGRLFLGSVAQRIARDSDIPVMVVKDEERSRIAYQGYHRILVPTDFSDSSVKAMDLGIRFANFFKADFHLIHVVETLTLSDLSGVYPFVQINEPQDANSSVNETLNVMIAEKEIAAGKKVDTLWGSPVAQILEYVEREKIDYIIMGTHGRKGIERFLLGSITAGILAKSPVPVITISSPEIF